MLSTASLNARSSDCFSILNTARTIQSYNKAPVTHKRKFVY